MGIEGEHVGARDGRPAQTLVHVLGHGYWAVPAALLEGSRAAVAAVHGGAAGGAGTAAAASLSAGAAASASAGSDVDADSSRLVYQPVTKVLLQPITGRRHQLRIHLRACGHAIVGDVTYAQADHDKPRMILHAWRLALQYPVKVQKPASAAGKGKGGGAGGGGSGKERGRGGGNGGSARSTADAASPGDASAAAAADGAAVSGGAGAAASPPPAEATPSPCVSAAAAASQSAAAAANARSDGKRHVPSGAVGIESPDPFTPSALAALVRECGIACAPADEPAVVSADAASWPQEAGLLLASDAAKPAGELVPPLQS